MLSISAAYERANEVAIQSRLDYKVRKEGAEIENLNYLLNEYYPYSQQHSAIQNLKSLRKLM